MKRNRESKFIISCSGDLYIYSRNNTGHLQVFIFLLANYEKHPMKIALNSLNACDDKEEKLQQRHCKKGLPTLSADLHNIYNFDKITYYAL